MKLRNMLYIIAVALILTSCAASTSDYLESKPLIFYSQTKSQNPELQDTSMEAFLKALNRYKWAVHGLDKTEKTIIAEACRGGMHCAEIKASFQKDGSVSIIRTPGQVLTTDEGVMLKKWIGNLQRQHTKNMRNAW